MVRLHLLQFAECSSQSFVTCSEGSPKSPLLARIRYPQSHMRNDHQRQSPECLVIFDSASRCSNSLIGCFLHVLICSVNTATSAPCVGVFSGYACPQYTHVIIWSGFFIFSLCRRCY